MTDHGFRFRTRRVIHLRETRSARQRHADGREVIARHVHRRHRNRGTFVLGLVEAFTAAPAAHGHAAGGVADIEVVGERPRVDDGRPCLCAQLSARADDEFDETLVVDAGRCRGDDPHQQQDGDDDAHPEAERHDADRREGAGPGQCARRMKQVGEAVNHEYRCVGGFAGPQPRGRSAPARTERTDECAATCVPRGSFITPHAVLRRALPSTRAAPEAVTRRAPWRGGWPRRTAAFGDRRGRCRRAAPVRAARQPTRTERQ